MMNGSRMAKLCAIYFSSVNRMRQTAVVGVCLSISFASYQIMYAFVLFLGFFDGRIL